MNVAFAPIEEEAPYVVEAPIAVEDPQAGINAAFAAMEGGNYGWDIDS